MALQYLDFTYSEDTDGTGTFEAMASVVGSAPLAAVHAEIEQILAWAFGAYPDTHGPLSEGFQWDHELQSQQEFTVCETIVFDAARSRLVARLNPPGVPRHTLTLSLSGGPAFCEALRMRFAIVG